MKKYILGFLLLGLMSIESKAQTVARTDDGGGFGIRGGVNFYNFSGSDASNNDFTNRAGFHAGIYSNLFLARRISLEPGVYYSIKGTQNDDLANSRAVLDYIDVPLLLRLYLTEGLNVFGGPQVSFLLRSKFEGDLFGSTFTYDTESISEAGLDFVLGLGYNLPRGLNIQGSYEMGTTPVFKGSNADIYNRGFKLSLGLSF